MKYKSQTEAVLAHLKEYGSITSYEAFEEYGATRLSAIIYLLRHRGHKIATELIAVPTRFGRYTNVAKYTLQKGR